MDVTVTSTVESALNSIKLKFARKALANGLRAGIKVLGGAILSKTPWTPEVPSAITKQIGSLKDNAGIKVQVNPDAVSGFAIFGFGRAGFVARWVEYGHVMVGHKVIGPQLKGKRQYESNRILGTIPSHPFVRPAFDETEQAAMQAFADEIEKSLEEPAITTPKTI